MTDDATRAQNRAAEPDRSVWLSANAGSGKTRVLTDRVARLLLGGTPPQNVLCLTFTKAAAGEMQNRLFRRLGEWAMLPDTPLRAALDGLEAGADVDLAEARRLFARAIETPGGLKIQTIHSFCAALLRQFPLEAGVSPGFTEMDESAQRHLMADVLEEMAEDDADGAIADLAALHAGEELDKLTARIASARGDFPDAVDAAAIMAATGLVPGDTSAGLMAALDLDPGLMTRLLTTLASGSTNDQKAGVKLSDGRWKDPGTEDLALLEQVMLFGEKTTTAPPFGSKAGRFPTGPTRNTMPQNDLDALDDLMDRVADLRPRRLALEAAENTIRLHRFATAFLPAYARAKARRGWLDFDDLIEGAANLLSHAPSADWVLYRMDGRIDHILVDEAQDTSPAQWRVVEALAQEFSAGAGARDGVQRTLFVVGDKKQSIYSFQGADAEGFDRMQAAFANRLSGGMAPAQLVHSFRSAPAILRAVDATFAGQAGEGVGADVRHAPFHEHLPGRVDLWPIVPKPDTPAKPDWTDPVDRVSADHPSRTLATNIAEEIKRLIDTRATIPVRGKDGKLMRRPVTEGDFLILVQTRQSAGRLFDALIRACKERGLAMAGADRIALSRELAVRDIRALLSFLALPEDDLSLAAALRSPLFGWDEDSLYRLAARRSEGRYLWQALRDDPSAADTTGALADLLARADFLRPFDLIEHILVACGGRRRLIARLGAEAEDGIDELLAQALSFERQAIPDLTGFLVWLDGEAAEVKRQTDMTGNAIQVMTVHGAKGLERPVVILPDTLRPDDRQTDRILKDTDGRPHWRPLAGNVPPALAGAVDHWKDMARRERNRLLYVAMTRAESWLIVCGGGDGGKDRQWYGLVEDGLIRAGADRETFGIGEGLRLMNGDWDGLPMAAAADPAPEAPAPPAWVTSAPPDPPEQPPALSPSALPGAKALPGESGALTEEEALRRGRQIHLLLERLPGVPAAERAALAWSLLREGEDPATAEEAALLAKQAGRLLEADHLAPVFAPGALREAGICATVAGRRLTGTIDVLIVDDDRVQAIDFKTNAVVPGAAEAVPGGILAQMGAYRAALLDIFPGRAVDTAILWTADATLMPLPNDMVMEAVRAATVS